MKYLHRGKAIRLRTGVIVALLDRRKHGWDCLVIGGDHPSYQPGGYDIMVFDEDLRDGEELDLKPPH